MDIDLDNTNSNQFALDLEDLELSLSGYVNDHYSPKSREASGLLSQLLS